MRLTASQSLRSNSIQTFVSFVLPEVVECEGLDVFGQMPLKKQIECVCPNCQRNLAANRFAPHLEKCMGMGRNSSRLASRRLVINILFFSTMSIPYHVNTLEEKREIIKLASGTI